jgi:hypothetical protein
LKFQTKDLALVCSFASLYAVLSFLSLSPVIGAAGSSIKMATIMAPLVGLILGPYLGSLATSMGGFIGWSFTQTGPFSFLSFVPGAASALCSGLLFMRKGLTSVVLYLVLFLALAFYPTIGPAWLFPYFLWFQLIGFVVLVSPLRLKATDSMHRHTKWSDLFFGLGVICFTATMFGQIVGSMMFEVMYWPVVYSEVEYWRVSVWQLVTFVYPVERTLITLLATLIGVPLIQALRAYKFEIRGIKTNAAVRDSHPTD